MSQSKKELVHSLKKREREKERKRKDVSKLTKYYNTENLLSQQFKEEIPMRSKYDPFIEPSRCLEFGGT